MRKPIGITVPYREVDKKETKKPWIELTKQEYDDIYVSNKDNIYRAMMVVATYLKRKNND
jgi:hypothetical protein